MQAVIITERHRSIDVEPRNIAARRWIAASLHVVAAFGLGGCYAFIPTTSTVLPEATPVTVKLTAGGSVALQPTLGQGVTELDGRVVRSSSDSLVVAVENMYTSGRQKFESSGTTASIPRPYVDAVQVRTFSRKRTTLMVLGGVAAAAIAGASISAGGGSSPGTGTQPPPP